MTSEQAETAITLSALVTGGTYAIRKLVEGEAKGAQSRHAAETTSRAFGSGPVLPLGQWLPAAGITFITLAIVGAISPDVGGAGAILVGAGTILGNGVALMKDLEASKPPAEGQADNNSNSSRMEPAITTVALNHPPVSKGVTA